MTTVLVYLLLVATSLVATGRQVSSAPPSLQHQDSELAEKKNLEKTADLRLLINETLKVNNKLVPENERANQSFREDWTFERVEYDLMDFLQELNARYQHSNKSSSDSNSTVDGQTQAKTQAKTQADLEAKREASAPSTSTTSSSVLPISLASGDHDISESTWQYGIFDRFTRPRAQTTTPHPADTIAVSGSSLDVRSFNSDECGLRSYRLDPDYFPQSLQLDTDEITKELGQRRQRPSLGAAFFQNHKKFHQGGATLDSAPLDRDLSRDELENRDKLLPPDFDQFGDPPSAVAASELEHRLNYSSFAGNNASGQPGTIFGPSNSGATGASADSEFNLSSRRQWLQQQLGSTLQMLGINSTNPGALDYFLNQTMSSSGQSGRENMMKMSGNKLAKSLGAHPASDIDPAKLSGPEISEHELKARQDELRLEARVIGGNDARLGDSPWSVSLQALVSRPGTGGLEYRHYCGGTIISEYYILTAAHCLDFMVGRESRLFVVVGDLNWRMSAASVHGRRFGIEKLIIHGGYKSTAFGHDIGLIRTKESMRPLKVNGRYIINSVCLPERNVEHSGEAELVGWGLFSNRNEMADMLQIADVPILPRPLCVDLYRRRTGLIQWLIGIELITEKQVCAGTFGRGICQGDSGSALVFNEKVQLEGKAASTRHKSQLARDSQQRATIIGVVAFGGIRRCSYQSLPGVYMQTSKYLDWILPRIQQ